MPIVSLPLTNQLTNGGTADGGQVLADLNAIASQVNANAAKSGVNSDITQLTALTGVPANVTATGWTLTNATINTPSISGGTITGSSIDTTTTGVTQTSGDSSTKLATTAYVVTYAAPLVSPNLTGTPTAPTATVGDSSTKIATTQFVQQTAFNSALPAQSAGVAGYVPITNGSTVSWGNRLDATIVGWKDHADATKQLLLSLTGITTGQTRTITAPDKNGTLAMLSDIPTRSMVLLATLTPTVAANVDALTAFTSGYDNYLIIGEGLLPSADDYMTMRLGVAGSADSGTNYYYNTAQGTSVTGTSTGVEITPVVLSAGKGCSFNLVILNANDATNIKVYHGTATSQNVATPGYIVGFGTYGAYTAANAVSGVRFYWNAGSNFKASGKIYIYGYSNT